jgi:hypothetical protein
MIMEVQSCQCGHKDYSMDCEQLHYRYVRSTLVVILVNRVKAIGWLILVVVMDLLLENP